MYKSTAIFEHKIGKRSGAMTMVTTVIVAFFWLKVHCLNNTQSLIIVSIAV